MKALKTGYITQVIMSDHTMIYPGCDDRWYIANADRTRWRCRDGVTRGYSALHAYTAEHGDDISHFDNFEQALVAYNAAKEKLVEVARVAEDAVGEGDYAIE